MNETRKPLGSPDATIVADQNVPQLSGDAAVAEVEEALRMFGPYGVIPISGPSPSPEEERLIRAGQALAAEVIARASHQAPQAAEAPVAAHPTPAVQGATPTLDDKLRRIEAAQPGARQRVVDIYAPQPEQKEGE